MINKVHVLLILVLLLPIITKGQIQHLIGSEVKWGVELLCDTYQDTSPIRYKECRFLDSVLCYTEVYDTVSELRITTSYYRNGAIWDVRYLLDGKDIGLYREYHPNGRLKSEGRFPIAIQNVGNDQFYTDTFLLAISSDLGGLSLEKDTFTVPKQGRWVYYYDNGKKQIAGNYKNNKRDGIWQYYYSNRHKVWKIEKYEDGQLIESIGDYLTPP